MGIVRLPERERVRLSTETHEGARRQPSSEASAIGQGRVVGYGRSMEIGVTRRRRQSSADRTTGPQRATDGGQG